MEGHAYFECEKYKLSIFYVNIFYFNVIYKKTYKKMTDKCTVTEGMESNKVYNILTLKALNGIK